MRATRQTGAADAAAEWEQQARHARAKQAPISTKREDGHLMGQESLHSGTHFIRRWWGPVTKASPSPSPASLSPSPRALRACFATSTAHSVQ
eukprot:5604942-Pyramimonas_sp.AAC.1